jgi:very-short-patch-repair endonuclease
MYNCEICGRFVKKNWHICPESNPFEGRHHNEKTKEKIRNSHYHKNLKGNKKDVKKGKTFYEYYGKERAEKILKKYSEVQKIYDWEKRFGKNKAKKLKEDLSERTKRWFLENKNNEKYKLMIIKQSESHKGKLVNQETREKIRVAHKEKFKDSKYAQMIMDNLKVLPNKLEIFFDKFLENNITTKFKYVGDGYTFIAGKCPDFINFEEKMIIELFGSYWHRNEEVIERTEHFLKYGYKTLIVWDYELKDFVKLKKRIENFLDQATKPKCQGVITGGEE